MGTRGILGHVVRGRRRPVFIQFDSYPTGLGVDLVAFIQSLNSAQIEQLIARLEQVEWVDENSEVPKELQERYSRFGDFDFSRFFPKELQERYTRFVDLAFGGFQPLESWNSLLRKAQGVAALPYILDGTLGHLIDGSGFEQYGVGLDWVYYVDWEKRELEVCRGRSDKVAKKEFSALSEAWMESLETKLGEDEEQGDDDEREDEGDEDKGELEGTEKGTEEAEIE